LSIFLCWASNYRGHARWEQKKSWMLFSGNEPQRWRSDCFCLDLNFNKLINSWWWVFFIIFQMRIVESLGFEIILDASKNCIENIFAIYCLSEMSDVSWKNSCFLWNVWNIWNILEKYKRILIQAQCQSFLAVNLRILPYYWLPSASFLSESKILSSRANTRTVRQTDR
jgi:hypothetical protein